MCPNTNRRQKAPGRFQVRGRGLFSVRAPRLTLGSKFPASVMSTMTSLPCVDRCSAHARRTSASRPHDCNRQLPAIYSNLLYTYVANIDNTRCNYCWNRFRFANRFSDSCSNWAAFIIIHFIQYDRGYI